MAEPTPEPRPGAAVSWQQDPRFTLVSFAADSLARFEHVLEHTFGAPSPRAPGHLIRRGRRCVLWAGPEKVHLFAEEEDRSGALAEQLRAACAACEPMPAVIDQSHGRAWFRISGSNALEALQKSCPWDISQLDESRCAQTLIGHFTVTIFGSPAMRELWVLVPSSYAQSFDEWLRDCSAELNAQAPGPGRRPAASPPTAPSR